MKPKTLTESLQEFLGIEDLTPLEAKTLSAVSAIIYQDGHMARMGETEKNLYGNTEAQKRKRLVAEAALCSMGSGSQRMQSLTNQHLNRMRQQIERGGAWGSDFEVKAINLQQEIKEGMSRMLEEQTKAVSN